MLLERKVPPTKRRHTRVKIGPDLKPVDYFSVNPVFRQEEFAAHHRALGRVAQSTASSLRYHVRTGRLRNLRRGLYATRLSVSPDAYLIGAKLTRHGAIGYQGALSIRGLTGLGHSIGVISDESVRYFAYNEVVYTTVRPGPLGWQGIKSQEWYGHSIRVASLERTFVELLDRLDLAPEPQELFEIFAAQRALDFPQMVEFAQKMKNRTCAGRVGVFLMHHPMVSLSEAWWRTLQRLAPKAPTYFDRAKRGKGEHMVGPYNIIVPPTLLEVFDAQRRRTASLRAAGG